MQAFQVCETFVDLITLSLRVDYSNSIPAKNSANINRETENGSDLMDFTPSGIASSASDDNSTTTVVSSATFLAHHSLGLHAVLPRLPAFSKPYHIAALSALSASSVLSHLTLVSLSSVLSTDESVFNPLPRFTVLTESRQFYAVVLFFPTLLALIGALLALAYVRGQLPRVWAYTEDTWVAHAIATRATSDVAAATGDSAHALLSVSRDVALLTDLRKRLLNGAPATRDAVGALHLATRLPVRRGAETHEFAVFLFEKALMMVVAAPRTTGDAVVAYPTVQNAFELGGALARGIDRAVCALWTTLRRVRSRPGNIRLEEDGKDEKVPSLEVKQYSEEVAGVLPPGDGPLLLKGRIFLKHVTRVSATAGTVPVLSVTVDESQSDAAGTGLSVELLLKNEEEREEWNAKLLALVPAAGGRCDGAMVALGAR